MKIRLPVALLICILVASCAHKTKQIASPTIPSKPGEQTTATEVTTTNSGKPESITSRGNVSTSHAQSFVIRGALAAKNKRKSWTASLYWQQSGANNYQIRLFGPFGNGAVKVESKNGRVTVKDGKETASSNNGAALLQKKTGINLPVHALYYWVRGLPAPGSISSVNKTGNKITSFHQLGYSINYQQFTNIKGKLLPSVIVLRGQGNFMKFKISQWSI